MNFYFTCILPALNFCIAFILFLTCKIIFKQTVTNKEDFEFAVLFNLYKISCVVSYLVITVW